jgi:N6-adenosine-specific RNA methylase IME4
MTAAVSFMALRPAGGFGLIMADPPWKIEMRSEKGYAKSPEAKYATMHGDAIKALPVELLAARDCVLWLWAMGNQLPLALEVMAAWGFEYKTQGQWAKMTPNGKQCFGQGYLHRDAGEPWLIGTRGAPKVRRSCRNVIFGLRREHSRKPDEVYCEAEKWMPNVQRADLFSRENRAGWTAWGDETGKFGVAP